MGMFSKSCISVLESGSQSGHKYVSDTDPLRVCHSAPGKVWAAQIDGWWSYLPFLEVYPCIPGWIWCCLMKKWGTWSGNGSWLCEMPVFNHLRSWVSSHSLGICFGGGILELTYLRHLTRQVEFGSSSLWNSIFSICVLQEQGIYPTLCLVPLPQSRDSPLEFPFLQTQGWHQCCFSSVVMFSSNEQLSWPFCVSGGLGGFHMGTQMKPFSAVTLHKSCKLLRAKG